MELVTTKQYIPIHYKYFEGKAYVSFPILSSLLSTEVGTHCVLKKLKYLLNECMWVFCAYSGVGSVKVGAPLWLLWS